MIILGVHGWAGTHDAAAALIVNDEVVGFVEEERLSRIKHAPSATPRLAARALLDAHRLTWEGVDVVAFGWDMPRYLPTRNKTLSGASDREILENYFGGIGTRTPQVAWVNHHLAHAASGFYSSQFERAAVLVVDGQGEDRSISLYRGGPDGLVLVRDWLPHQSLGFMYEAVTLYCGFGHLDAGKTMGLAAYGEALEPLDLRWIDDDLHSPVPVGLDEDEVVTHWRKLLCDRFGPSSAPRLRLDPTLLRLRWAADGEAQHRPEVAAVAQRTLEGLVSELVAYAIRTTGCRNVVLAGGVALNCVANSHIMYQCDALYIPPVPHDAGCALGAAQWVSHERSCRRPRFDRQDIGLAYTNSEYEDAFARAGLRPRAVDRPAIEAAKRVEAGRVVAWFQGGGEPGPRALGRRSILADPRQAENHSIVNRIKARENWRPLAPSALEDETEFLVGRAVRSPYMLLSLPLTQRAQQELPAITHVDGSSRLQTVSASDGQDPYAELVECMRSRTGYGVVLNTSFNDSHEPIVQSPLDAMRTFHSTPLDSLVIGNWILDKHP